MEMHQIRYFLSLCDTLNFTRAAEACNVSQPALTRAISQLEGELGGPLVRRERRNTHLTELGQLMRRHFETIFIAHLEALSQAHDYQEMKTAPLHLGIMCTINPTRLVGFFQELQDRVPTLDLSLHEASGKALIEDLQAGEIDVAIVGMPEYPERFELIPLFRERYAIAFPPGHRFVHMNGVPVREVNGEDYLSRVHCEFRYHFDKLGQTEQLNVNVRYQSEREDWIQAMTLAGMGCAVMPESTTMLPAIQTRPLVEPEIWREVSLAYIAGRRFTPTVQAMIHLARNFHWTSPKRDRS